MKLVKVANLTLTGCCLLFLSLLAIIYFSKKNMNNLENKIYKHLIIWSIVNLVVYFISLICYFLFSNFYYNLIYSQFTTKMTGVCTVVWFTYFAIYIKVITKQKSKKKSFLLNNKHSHLYITLLILILIIIALVLPLQFVNENNEVKAFGIAAVYYWLTSLICIFTSLISLITHIKQVSVKKAIPLLLITILLPISIVLNRAFSIFIVPLSMTIVSYLMYFTIENPDIKLINELTLAKNEAERSNNAKSYFLSSMSHELRTPLNAIVGLSQIIQLNNNLDEIHNDSEEIIIASNNLLDLVNIILDINQIESNNMDLELNNYNPRGIYKDLLKISNLRIKDKNIELRSNYSDNIPKSLFGDNNKIKSIINNLLTNAIKYTEKGFVDFSMDSNIEKGKFYLLITIKDTGRGLTKEQIDNLYTKFNRLEEDKDSNIQGAGLGLALTKSLVDLLNGSISVKSDLGVGTTFVVKIPQEITTDNNSNKNIEQNAVFDTTKSLEGPTEIL